jgi:AcrR family transcriptional regulator
MARRGRGETGTRARPPRDRGIERRAELLDRVVDHLLRHGVANFSLRSASDLVGASARMLVHHFGSRERLLSEALAVVRARRIERFAPSRAMPIGSFDEVFRESWRTLASDDFRRYFLLNQELVTLAVREPRRYRTFLRTTTEEWRTGLAAGLLAHGFSPEDASAVSTVYMAALRGLLLDLVVTRDRERVDAALELVAERLKQDIERYPRRARPVSRAD